MGQYIASREAQLLPSGSLPAQPKNDAAENLDLSICTPNVRSGSAGSTTACLANVLNRGSPNADPTEASMEKTQAFIPAEVPSGLPNGTEGSPTGAEDELPMRPAHLHPPSQLPHGMTGCLPPSHSCVPPPQHSGDPKASLRPVPAAEQMHAEPDMLGAEGSMDSSDDLCYVVNIPEFDTLRLMITFQTNLKLMVCSRCRCAIFSDHIAGHVWKNHKKLLPRSFQKSQLEEAVMEASKRLQAVASCDPLPVLPARFLPPLPWLRDHEPGFKCQHCSYAAKSMGSISTHGHRSHPGKGPYISREDPSVPVQCLFQGKHYFMVHPILRNAGPNNPFVAFYSSLPAEYMNGAFVDARTTNGSGPDDLAPFLVNTGWADAMEGFSMTELRGMSDANAQEGDPPWFSRVKGLGKKYFSSIRSVSGVDPRVLEALTSWRTRLYVFKGVSYSTLYLHWWKPAISGIAGNRVCSCIRPLL